MLIRFEPVDNSPGEAEASGALRPGFRCVARQGYSRSLCARVHSDTRPILCATTPIHAHDVCLHPLALVLSSLTSLNDTTVAFAPFPSIIAALVNAGRPLRLTFRDPDVHEFRDRCATYGRHAGTCVSRRRSRVCACAGAPQRDAGPSLPTPPQVLVFAHEAARGARGRALLRLRLRVVAQ